MTQPSFFGYLLSPKIISETTWEVLGNFERKIAGDPATIVTFNFPAIDFDSDSMLVLTFDGSFSVATDVLLRAPSTVSSPYNTYGRRIIGGVETLINLINQNGYRVNTGSLITGGGNIVQSITYIQLNKAGTFKETGFQSVANGVSANGNEVFSGALNLVAGITSISSVSLQLTAGGWNIGTRITLYKVSR